MKNFFELLLLNIKINFYNLIEYLKVIFNYYPSPLFLKTDLYLQSIYLFDNPFSISKKFHSIRGDQEIYVYGETPLTIWDKIAREAEIHQHDVFYDLGCGRGRIVFWTNALIGCESIGIEQISDFVLRANQVKDYFRLNEIHFIQENLISADLSRGTVFYFYNNFLSDEKINELAIKLNQLQAGTKVITVSFPFSDYSTTYEVLNMFPAHFPWGWADVYISTKI